VIGGDYSHDAESLTIDPWDYLSVQVTRQNPEH